MPAHQPFDKIEIRRLQGNYPMHLLLLADETEKAIGKYLPRCEVYEVCLETQQIGVIAIEELNSTTIEIRNIAITDELQGKGIGRNVIAWVMQEYAEKGFEDIFVGTGDASVIQLLFYQKCGFEIDSIRKNFFLENYEVPVLENGVRLKHMVMLKMTLTKN